MGRSARFYKRGEGKMDKQHKLQTVGRLLDEHGHLSEQGYATRLMKQYDRKDVAAPVWRIKEWDYYLIATDRFALALTIADNGYMGLDSISFLSFDGRPWEKTFTRMSLMPLGRRHLPATSVSGDVQTAGRGYRMTFENKNSVRRLVGNVPDFLPGRQLLFDIAIAPRPGDSMVIATPFHESPRDFYYNQKINCLVPDGRVLIGDDEYLFSPASARAVLDWGRGVWTYRNTWYWGSLSCVTKEGEFGLNLGYGFCDTSAASENMAFLNGHAHKLGRVVFHIPEKDGQVDYMSPWRITDQEGRVDLVLEPVLDRSSRASAGLICSDQHQVFGRFTGRVTLDDGRVVSLERRLGFAEKVCNRW